MLLPVPPAISTLAGLTSRCTSPRACAASSAAATWVTIRAARPGLEPALQRDQLAQVGALDEAHRHVQRPVLLARVVDRDHVGVVERRGDLRLALEALAELGVLGQLGGDQLERDRAVQREVDGAVDDAHAAAAGHRLDPVAADHRTDLELRHDAGLYRPKRADHYGRRHAPRTLRRRHSARAPRRPACPASGCAGSIRCARVRSRRAARVLAGEDAARVRGGWTAGSAACASKGEPRPALGR